MKYKQSITVFIPAYNEEDNIKEAASEILNYLRNRFEKYELILVINVCKDRTFEIATDLAKKNKNIKVIQQKKFVGYGTQLKVGWENAKNELIFYTDSDRQFKIDELDKLMKFIEDYDVVVGYRKKRNDPFMRVVYSKVYNLALRFLLGLNFRDIDCAFKLCKRKVIDNIKPFSQDRSADAEFLVKAISKGFRVKELPVTHKKRTAGVSEAETGKNRFFIKIKPEIIKALINETLYLRRFRK